MNKNISIISLKGAQIIPFLSTLSQIRMETFREFPYLYEGSEHYERSYLEPLQASKNSILVLARDNTSQKIIGISTGLPLQDSLQEVQQPFINHGYDVNDIFFFAESAILPAYRGKGIGRLFFKDREKLALETNPTLKYIAFWSVVRPSNHPKKPKNYKSLTNLWHRQGFKMHNNLTAQLSWPEVDKESESLNTMSIWIKELPTPAN